jgi:hypothetical protein
MAKHPSRCTEHQHSVVQLSAHHSTACVVGVSLHSCVQAIATYASAGWIKVPLPYPAVKQYAHPVPAHIYPWKAPPLDKVRKTQVAASRQPRNTNLKTETTTDLLPASRYVLLLLLRLHRLLASTAAGSIALTCGCLYRLQGRFQIRTKLNATRLFDGQISGSGKQQHGCAGAARHCSRCHLLTLALLQRLQYQGQQLVLCTQHNCAAEDHMQHVEDKLQVLSVTCLRDWTLGWS